MGEGSFWNLLADIARDTDPASPEFEPKLRRDIDERSASSKRQFDKEADKIIMSGPLPFDNDSQSESLLSMLGDHTVYGTQAFVARCLPELLEARKQHSKQQQTARRVRRKTPARRRVSNSSSGSAGETGRRRSPRIHKLLNTPPG